MAKATGVSKLFGLAVLVAAALAAAAAPAPAGASSRPAHVLRVGSHGTAVEALQRRLHLPTDGDFGRRTARAVRRFQHRHDLRETGRVDRATRHALGLDPRRPQLAQPESVRTGGTPATELATAPELVPSPGEAASAMVAAARSALGRPYRRAAAGPDGFDCSGLVVWAARSAGFGLPRSSFEQYRIGAPIATEAIAAGDLVFFDTAGPGASDVGIASGPTTAISATTHGVREHTIGGSYWGAHLVGARRVG